MTTPYLIAIKGLTKTRNLIIYLEQVGFFSSNRCHHFSFRLENYPQFLMLLFIGGIQYPLVTAVAGLVWIAGKVSYSLGYYTGGKFMLIQITYMFDTYRIKIFIIIILHNNRSCQKNERRIQLYWTDNHVGNINMFRS